MIEAAGKCLPAASALSASWAMAGSFEERFDLLEDSIAT
jgi:hypothetical protein